MTPQNSYSDCADVADVTWRGSLFQTGI